MIRDQDAAEIGGGWPMFARIATIRALRDEGQCKKREW
jgi:hypothetical protein